MLYATQIGRLPAKIGTQQSLLMDNRKSILILDDDESMLRSLERGLRVRGYETEAYRCVTEFLGRARIENSRCLLLDINLKRHVRRQII